MNLRKQALLARLYRAPAGEGGDEGGGAGAGGQGGEGGGAGAGDGGAGGAGDGKGAGAGSGDGKPKISDAEAALLKDLMKHKDASKAAQAEVASLKESLKKFEGIDPEAVRALLAEKAAAEEKALEAKGEWDRLKERMAEAHRGELSTVQSQLAELQAKLAAKDSMIDELSVGTQFGQSKFIAEELTLTPAKTRVVFGGHFELVDGVVTGYDKPKGAASRTPLVDSAGVPLEFDAALRKIVEADADKDHLLKSKARAGSGSANSAATSAAKATQAAAEASKEAPTGLSKISAGLGSLKVGK